MSLLSKILYSTKTNVNAIVNRPTQATAEDFNEIKTVVNLLVDAVNGMKCDEVALVAGSQTVNFNDAYPAGTLFVITSLHCIDSNGYHVNHKITNKTINGFDIEVSKDCNLLYLCMPKR